MFLAPWPTEFGSKVGLLAGLTVASVLRYPLERVVAAWRTRRDRAGSTPVGFRPIAALACVVGVLLFGTSAALAGAPNRATPQVGSEMADATVARADALSTADVGIDGSLPEVAIAPDVAALSSDLAAQDGALELVDALMFNLGVESEALALGDPSLLTAVDHGDRLIEQTDRVESSEGGQHVRSVFRIAAIQLGVVFPGGLQSGPNAGLRLIGSVSDTVIDADGRPGATVERPLDTTFTLRRTPNGVWLTTGTVPST